MERIYTSAILFLTALFVSPAVADDLPAGRDIYVGQCFSCHNMACTRGHYGPALGNVFGQPAGADPDFRYSDALRQSGIVWDEAKLDKWLADPAAMVPGTTMRPIAGVTVGVADAEDRRNLIAYLLSGDTSLDLC